MKASHDWRLPLCAVLAFAVQAAGAATGKEIFATTCAACHGAGAQGNPALGAPALAGQGAGYLERQLNDFRSGLRGSGPKDSFGNQMRAASATLADGKAIAAVSAYLASLPPPVVKPAANANLRNGNNFYQGKCGACHGGRAEGIASMSTPRLSGLDAAYLTRQFHNFRQGTRGSSPKDRYGRQMAMMAGTLPKDSDLADVIAFIHAQGAAK
jgi:cytochrome c oxidase subunit 2